MQRDQQKPERTTHNDSIHQKPNATDEHRDWRDTGEWRRWAQERKAEKLAE